MLKCLVLLCFAQVVLAYPSTQRTQQEIDEFRSFLMQTKQDNNLTLEEAMATNRRASPWENSGKYEGDMLLFDEEIEELVADYAGHDDNNNVVRKRRAAAKSKAYLWPGKTVFYKIADNHFNQKQISMIQKAAKFFESTTCVRWVPRTTQNDYVIIHGSRAGCYAHVGYMHKQGGHQLNLAPGCFQLNTIIHEMMHSVGFYHMHQSHNRDDWVTIHYQNVSPGQNYNFNLLSKSTTTMLDLPYEYASVQHYGPWAFSKNGRKTIIPIYDDKGQMGQNSYVTRLDVLRLSRLYECPGAWTVKIGKDDINKPLNEKFAKRLREAAMREQGVKV